MKICVTRKDGSVEQLSGSRFKKIPHRILKKLFGTTDDVMVITPGMDMRSVEIHECKEETT